MERYLSIGGLPHIHPSPHAKRELQEYVSLYLREEIAAGALTRNVEAFSEFLDMVGRSNTNEISYQSFANDCGVSINTIKNYFQILEDTMIGFRLPAYTKTKKRKAITRAKHYLFDIGMANSLCEVSEVTEKSNLFGPCFEHFIISEVRAFLSYSERFDKLHYWRSVNQQEVDLLIGQEFAIEIKASNKVNSADFKGLRALREEGHFAHYVFISLDKYEFTTDDGIRCMNWQTFLNQLWTGEFLKAK